MMNRAIQPAETGSRRRRAFTLIELLMVVGLMGIVLVVMVAGFNNINSGAKMRSALLQLKSSVSLARQYAVTSRDRAYLVFPDTTCTFSDAAQGVALSYQAWSVFSPVDGYVTEWSYLPRGIAFDRNIGSLTSTTGNSSGYNVFTNMPAVSTGPRFNIAQVNGSFPYGLTVPCIAFKPQGNLVREGSPVSVFLIEGSLNLTDAAQAVVTQANRRVRGIRVNPLTGQASYQDY